VSNLNSTFDFLFKQVELFREQHDAVERGDLAAVKVCNVRLKLTLPEFARQFSRLKKLSENDKTIDANLIDSTVAEIKELHRNSLELLQNKRDDLAQLLRGLDHNRQIMTRYSSGRQKKSKIFEITG
jgi:hypothetical protein